MNFSYLTLAGSLALAGCFPDGPGEKGELGNDRFFYECALPADAMCDEQIDTELLSIPTVALGATFALTSENLDTEPFSPTDRLREVQVSSGAVAFVAEQEGQAVVISRSEAGQGSDLTHIVVVPATSVAFYLRDTEGEWAETPAVAVDSGVFFELRVAPRDEDDNTLAGALPLVWTAEPEGIVTLPPSTEDNVLGLTAMAGGQVTLTAELGDLSATIVVNVTEVP